MSHELTRNEWSIIISHESFLELRWLPASEALDDANFAGTLDWFARETERLRPRGVLSDAVDLLFKPQEPMLAWGREKIIPRCDAAGVRGFAFVVGPGHPQVGHETHEGTASFPTRWFRDRAAAIAWLTTRA
jgi:hypothetical protein